MRNKRQQLNLAIKQWGGKRAGSGRKNLSGRRGHIRRPKFKSTHPLHITWKLGIANVSLRCGEVLDLFKNAAKSSQRKGLSVLHFSLQSNHLHLIVEVGEQDALARGMKSFGCCLGKGIRRIAGGRGSVFSDRYHLHVLRTPTETRRAIAYVLQNTSKHTRRLPHLDRYSSAPYFEDWLTLLGPQAGPIVVDRSPLKHHPNRGTGDFHSFLSPPRSWLARTGWKRGH